VPGLPGPDGRGARCQATGGRGTAGPRGAGEHNLRPVRRHARGHEPHALAHLVDLTIAGASTGAWSELVMSPRRNGTTTLATLHIPE